MDKKVLVTGASGLIGRELVKQLLSLRYDVTAIDNNSRFGHYVPCEKFTEISVEDFVDKNPNTFDTIYHLAAINGTRSFYDHPNKVLKNNVLSDLKIFEYARLKPDCKIVYASSSEVVSGTKNYPTSEETDIMIENIHNPRWSYRLPKILAENYLFNSDMDFVLIRFFNVFSEHSGPGHFFKDIVEKIKNKNFDIVGANETRSFCYVSDAVDAMIKVSYASKILINIGSPEEITVLDAANIIAAALGCSDIKWKTTEKFVGSCNRRNPDLSTLLKLYPQFSPRDFKTVIDRIMY